MFFIHLPGIMQRLTNYNKVSLKLTRHSCLD